jgi:hypothetical protein
MRRSFRIIAITAAALVVTVAVVVFIISRAGTTRLEQWIGSQLQDTVNTYINPRLSFADLDYQAPYTVALKDLSLVADDPHTPGRTIDIISCSSGTVTLAEIPQVGKPIVIKEVILDKPAFQLIAIAPGDKRMVGYDNFLREKPTSGPSTSALTTQQRAKLSDLLQMRLVKISEGRIVYDPRIEGTAPMELDHINTTLKIEPTEAGWYKLGATMARAPLFDLSVAGQLNLDDFSARDAALKLRADLSPNQLSYLPPQLQQVLKKYDVHGALEAMVLGEFPILKPLEGQGSADVTLTDANVTLGEYRIPVNRLEMSARLEERVVHMPVFKIDALRGSLQATAATQMNEQFDTRAKLQINGMMLEDLLAGHKEGQPAKFAGKVDGEVDVSAPARIIGDRIRGRPSAALSENWGSAWVKVNQGTLVSLPTLKKITEALSSTLRLVGAGADDVPSDRLSAQASFNGDRATITELTFVGDVLAARGKGTVGLDQSIDVTINAGPIAKVQDVLGSTVGGAIAKLTDKLVAYRVTGKLKEPKVEVEVAGGAVDKVGTTLDRIGEGIGDFVNPKEKK